MDLLKLFIDILIVLLLAIIFTLLNKCCRTSTSYRMRQQQRATSSATQTPTGLSARELESVKCVKYKASSSECDAISCSICLSKLKDEEEVRILAGCNHSFH